MSKIFLVTGASRGLGLAIAETLLSASHKVVLVARTESELKKIKRRYPSNVEYIAADLADLSVAPKIIHATLSAFGNSARIDGLVINHGVLTPLSRIADSKPEEWSRAYDVNVFSAVALIKEAIPSLRESEGRIVFVSSGAAIGAYAAWGAYGTAKAAINHLCAHVAVEEPSITTVAISPGKVDTIMQQQIRDLGGAGGMDTTLHASFVHECETGSLLRPEQPGAVIAKVVERATRDLSGKHFRWNSQELASYQ